MEWLLKDCSLVQWKKFRIAVWVYLQAGLPEWMTFCTWFWLHKIQCKGILRDYTVCTDRGRHCTWKTGKKFRTVYCWKCDGGPWVCGFAEWNLVTRCLSCSSVCFYWWKWCCWIYCFGCHWCNWGYILLDSWTLPLDESHWTWELVFVTLLLMCRTMFKLLANLDLDVFMH